MNAETLEFAQNHFDVYLIHVSKENSTLDVTKNIRKQCSIYTCNRSLTKRSWMDVLVVTVIDSCRRVCAISSSETLRYIDLKYAIPGRRRSGEFRDVLSNKRLHHLPSILASGWAFSEKVAAPI